MEMNCPCPPCLSVLFRVAAVPELSNIDYIPGKAEGSPKGLEPENSTAFAGMPIHFSRRNGIASSSLAAIGGALPGRVRAAAAVLYSEAIEPGNELAYLPGSNFCILKRKK